ncbi:MAG: RND family transporter [Methanosarcinaceae archaeon]|nr:RND family transporter [Methanosarcinaceae archaeon]
MKEAFEKLGIFIEDNPLPILLIVILLIVLAVQGAQQIEMESGTETFVEKDSALYQDFDYLYLNIFATESIIVIIENGDVTKPELLKAAERLESSVGSIRGVTGISSAVSVIKNANYQLTGKYEIPDSEKEIDSIISSHSSEFTGIMPDGTHALMYVEMKGDVSDNELTDIQREIEKTVELADFPPQYTVIVTGDPAFMVAMQNEMNSSMGPLLMISAIFMVIVLYMVFRHVRWKLLPLPIVLLGIIYTFGAMGYLKIPLSMVSMSAFPILIGLGIDYAIQFHNRIEEELERNDNEEVAVIETIKHTGPAVLIALIITSLGFFSLFTSTVPMIQDFGKLLFIGIIMCFLSALFVGVTVIYGLDTFGKKRTVGKTRPIALKDSHRNNDPDNSHDILSTIIEKTTTFTVRHPAIVLAVTGFLCISGLYVDSFVPVQTDVTNFVPQDMPALIDLVHLGDIIGGTDALNLIIKVDDSADPNVLKWIDDFSTHEVEGRGRVYGASSIVPIIKTMNGDTIPDNSADIERLYEQIPDMQKNRYMHGKNMLLLDLDIGNAVADIKLEGITELMGILKEDIAWMPPPPGTSVTITGNSVVFTTVFTALTSGRIAMTLLGLMMVFVGLLVIYRDWIKALTPVVTMFIVIGWAGGIMYYSGLEYTPMTATLGALILGVGSEYAVLMMERYYEEKENGANPLDAIREASTKIGKAIFASGLTTVFGFSALIASPFSMTSNFGLVTVMDVALALIATFIVFPPVIVLLDGWRDQKKAKRIAKYTEGNTIPRYIHKPEVDIND